MTHNGGRLMMNLIGAAPYYDFWAINACKMQQNSFYSSNYAAEKTYPTLLDANGYPTAMPIGGGATWNSINLRIWGNSGDTWDLVYPSQHTLILSTASSATITETVSTAGHKRYTISGTPPWDTFGDGSTNPCALVSLRITAMSGNDWTGGISLYRTEHQARVDAGEIFEPRFLARLGYGTGQTAYGMLRAMDLQDTISCTIRKYSQRRLLADYSWLAPPNNVTYYAGLATKTLNNYTTGTRFPGNPASWTDGQPVQFFIPSTPTTLTITAKVLGSPTQFTCAAHGLNNGDEIEVDLNSTGTLASTMSTKSNTTGVPPKYAITKLDANTFTIPVDSTALTATIPFYVTPVITVSDGTLAAKRVLRKGFTCHYSSEWAAYASGWIITGTYYSDFDCISMTGDRDVDITSGPPPEILCYLANKLKSHLYVCTPAFMDGAELRSWITLLHNTLDSELMLIFEFQNELWNFLDNKFQMESYATLSTGLLFSQYGHSIKLRNLAAAAATVLGGTGRVYKIATGVQNVSTPSTNTGLLRGPMTNAATVTIASPGVVTWTAHGRSANDKVLFTTSGALPTGLNADQEYFVKTVLNANTFTVSATSGGAVINTSGTQSGSHWVGTPTDYTQNKCDIIVTAPYLTTNFQYYSNAADYPGYQTALLAWKAGNTSTAYDWMAAELSTGTAQPGFPQAEPLAKHISTFIPGWTAATSTYTGRSGTGIEIWNYEGGNGIPGADSLDGGFPTGGITVQNVRDFFDGYLRSTQHATVCTNYAQGMKDAGVIWPSQYTASNPWTSGGVWGAWPTNAIDSSETLQWRAYYTWNLGSGTTTPTTPTTTTTQSGGNGGFVPAHHIRWPKKKRLSNTEQVAAVVSLIHEVAKQEPELVPPAQHVDYQHIAQQILLEKKITELRKIVNAKKIALMIDQIIERDDEEIFLHL